jgi:hypothetical protein
MILIDGPIGEGGGQVRHAKKAQNACPADPGGCLGAKTVIQCLRLTIRSSIMATLTVTDATYQRLQANAAARKLSLDAYLAEVASQSASALLDSSRQIAALESFSEGMNAWTSGHLLLAMSLTTAVRPFTKDAADEDFAGHQYSAPLERENTCPFSGRNGGGSEPCG